MKPKNPKPTDSENEILPVPDCSVLYRRFPADMVILSTICRIVKYFFFILWNSVDGFFPLPYIL